MRRPLALFGFTFLACSLCYVVLGHGVAGFVAAFFLIAVILLLFLGRKYKNDRRIWSLQGCCLAALCAFILLYSTTAFYVTPLASLYDTTKELTMTVVQEEGVYDTSSYYVVKAEGLYPDSQRSARLRLRTDGVTSLRAGDVVVGDVVLEEVPSQSRARLYGDRVFLTATTAKNTAVTVVGTSRGIPYYAGIARSYIKNFIQCNLDEDVAGIMTGICLGDTSALSSEVTDSFNDCGMAHMVAVSGLHTNMVGGLLIGLFLMMNTGKRYAKLISVLFVWGFVFVAGAPYSAMRAGIMFTIFAVGTLFHRLPDMLNTLGGAVFVILLLYPFAAGDIGFMASVGACVGIILLATYISRFLLYWLPKKWRSYKLVKGAADSMGVTVGAFLADVPCSLLCFYDISLVAPISNLLGIPLATFVLLSGLGSTLISLVPGFGFLAELLLGAGGLCAKVLIGIASFFGGFSFARIPFASVWCYGGFALMLVGGSLLYIYRYRFKPIAKNLIAAALVLIMVATSFIPVYRADEYEIMVIGEGYDTTLAVAGKEGTVVIGCASPYRVQKVLGSRGIDEIDCLILPNRLSYQQNLDDFLRYFMVKQVMTHSVTDARGLLVGMEKDYDALSFDNTFTLGNITVTAYDDFTFFAVTVNGQQILYADSAIGKGDYDYTIYNPMLQEGKRTLIQGKGERFAVNQPMIFKITGDKIRIYQPRFVYG